MEDPDYYPCDRCRRKTYYDSDVSYVDCVGAMVVLCVECSKTHTVIVTPVDQANEVAELRASLMEAVSIYEPRKSSIITVEDLLSRSLRQHSWLAKAKRILAATEEEL